MTELRQDSLAILTSGTPAFSPGSLSLAVELGHLKGKRQENQQQKTTASLKQGGDGNPIKRSLKLIDGIMSWDFDKESAKLKQNERWCGTW